MSVDENESEYYYDDYIESSLKISSTTETLDTKESDELLELIVIVVVISIVILLLIIVLVIMCWKKKLGYYCSTCFGYKNNSNNIDDTDFGEVNIQTLGKHYSRKFTSPIRKLSVMTILSDRKSSNASRKLSDTSQPRVETALLSLQNDTLSKYNSTYLLPEDEINISRKSSRSSHDISMEDVKNQSKEIITSIKSSVVIQVNSPEKLSTITTTDVIRNCNNNTNEDNEKNISPKLPFKEQKACKHGGSENRPQSESLETSKMGNLVVNPLHLTIENSTYQSKSENNLFDEISPSLPPKTKPILPSKQKINKSVDEILKIESEFKATLPRNKKINVKVRDKSNSNNNKKAPPPSTMNHTHNSSNQNLKHEYEDYDEPSPSHEFEDYDDPIHHSSVAPPINHEYEDYDEPPISHKII